MESLSGDGAAPGLSDRLGMVLDRHVGSGRIVGAVVAVAREGETVAEIAAGWSCREDAKPAAADTIFRLASLTKPIVSCAALALVERGMLSLDGAVHDWLPDFRPRLPDGTTPVITVAQLLSHGAGLGYGFLQPPDGPYHRLGVSDGLDALGVSMDENLRRIAAAPLLFPPGHGWCYSVSTDVLGAVVERAYGGTLAEAVSALVTGPLGLADTGFAPAARDRLSTPYIDREPFPAAMADNDTLAFGPGLLRYVPSRLFDTASFLSGGGGMVGTAPDYLKLLETLRTGGGAILRPETVAALTTHAVGGADVFIPGPGWGFGLGVGIVRDPAAAGVRLSPGSWGWFGVFGLHFWVDPLRRLSVVAMTNTAVSGMVGPFADDLREAVVGASADYPLGC